MANATVSLRRTRCSSSSAESSESVFDEQFKHVDRQLSRFEWFHGVMPRSDCEEMLKNDGDFLLRRTTVAGITKYCITVRFNNEAKHIPVTYAKQTWSLLEDNKPTLAELIDAYVKQRKPIPPSNSILSRPVPRPEYFFMHEDVILGKKLGRGAFGEVYEGKLRLKNGSEVFAAVKRARQGHLKKSRLLAFIREAKIMRRLYHPNIVRLLGVAAQEEPVMILLELAVNGSMKDFFKKHENVSINQKLDFARDACRGMCYLSGSKVIHRDLAARNCLLGSSNEVKISDFGLSVMDKNAIRLNRLHKVPVRWLSPETLNEGIFTTKTDVWSFGVLLWEIFANCTSDPFPGISNSEAIQLITGNKVPIVPPEGSPPAVKQVMDLCFIKNSDARADFAAVFRILAPSEQLPTPTRISFIDARFPPIGENNNNDAAHMPPASA